MPNEWGRWVRDEMARRHWDQSAAARAAGLPRSAISQWVTSDATPTVKNLRKFADAVDAPVVQALVIAGYITEEEASWDPATNRPVEQWSNEELAALVLSRMNGEEVESAEVTPIHPTQPAPQAARRRGEPTRRFPG